MKPFHFLLGLIFAISLILVLLTTAIEVVLYWTPGYFEKEYHKYEVAEEIDMEMDDLLEVTEVMMDYLRGDREDLQVVTWVDGTRRGFFSQRELDHMVDVKNLFLAGFALRRICLLLALVSVGLIYFLKGKVSSVLAHAMCVGTGIFFAAVCLIAAVAAADFRKAFWTFHEIFFDNDLWILDPNKDLLINIVPEPFFIDTTVRIGVLFGGSILLILAGCFLHLRRSKRNKAATINT